MSYLIMRHDTCQISGLWTIKKRPSRSCEMHLHISFSLDVCLKPLETIHYLIYHAVSICEISKMDKIIYSDLFIFKRYWILIISYEWDKTSLRCTCTVNLLYVAIEPCIIKLITAVIIYGFRNKLECLCLASLCIIKLITAVIYGFP